MKYFSEIQRFPRWIFFLIASSLSTVLIILGSVYARSTSPPEKKEILIAFVVIILFESLAILFITRIKQEVRIDRTGIHYRYPPFKNKEVQIPISKIKNYDCITYSRPQYGYKAGRWAFFVKTPSITTIGISKVIKLTFIDGSTFLIGTKKPSEFIQTLDSLKNRNEET
ncbi:hypothetical protein GWK08_02380 [Leptobacterium flavescens]|uniref:Bacterial Pleckstrin homology domain-containing protein n=1 Tax=Leptobacterium flavescens TaxID=472055 RepID=A0A6P0UK65_9FLAO|nr:hypothetical protein [Leptobacterium flavescens]NER12278.1 hypothetical protein [Leptobacterium flavescens]